MSHPQRPAGCRIAAAGATRRAHSAWGSCSRGLRIQGLEEGLQQTVGRQAPLRNRPLATRTRQELLLTLVRRRLMLALARRRLPAAKSSSTSKPLVPARRLLLALARRRLLLALTRRRLHVANAPLKHARRLPPNSSSCGSAAIVSMPGSLARPHSNSSARPLLPASTMRTNASFLCCRRRSSVCRWPPHKPRHSPMRLKSNTGRLRRQL